MRILLCPDSFKGSLSASRVCEAMRRGVLKVLPDALCTSLPIADGGEGTVESLVNATGGEFKMTEVHDPLGRKIDACWGVLGQGNTAVIEMASASGLPLLAANERDPRIASTFGTGELIAAALDTLTGEGGRPRLIIGIGGSATNDGGSGALRALGARFLDAHDRELSPGGAALAELARIDTSALHPRLAEAEILVACDVDNPLTGERGASAVFGPQKGATPEMVSLLDSALSRFAEVAATCTGKDVAAIAGAGAAGGLGAGLLFFSSAKLMPGIRLMLDAIDFDRRVQEADLVLTGEGCCDYQTVYGKAPVGVAEAAKLHGKAVMCISGVLGTGAEAVYAHGIDALMGSVCSFISVEECMANADVMLEAATERAMRLFRLGMEHTRRQ